jgi:hypothetical protein
VVKSGGYTAILSTTRKENIPAAAIPVRTNVGIQTDVARNTTTGKVVGL